jgi:hypothetical protein
VIVTAVMDETTRSAWCREQGLYLTELDAWKRDAIAGLGEPRAASAVEAREDHRRTVRTVIYVTDIDDAESVGRAHHEVFGDVRPARTMVQVVALARPEMRVEIEAYAVIDATGRTASASSSPLARIFGEPVRSTHAELVRRAGCPAGKLDL